MFNKWMAAGAVVIVLAGAGLVASGGSADAKRVARPSIAAPTRVVAGHAFKITVRPAHAGRVVLQRKLGSGWRAVAHKRSSGGRITFLRTERTAGMVAYRARVGQRFSPVQRVSVRPRTLPPPPAGPELSISVDSTDDVYVNDTYTVAIETYRGDDALPGRTVTVQRRDPGSSTWVTAGAGTYTTDGDGEASFQDSSAKRGLVQYRATSGSLSGLTQVPVFETVPMPVAGLVQKKSPACGANVTGDGNGNVQLTLKKAAKTTSKPACNVNGGSVQVTWSMPDGECVPVQYDALSLTGGSGASGTLSLDIDGVNFVSLAGLGTHGRQVFNGDPMAQLVLTMTSTANADLTASITGAQAVCL